MSCGLQARCHVECLQAIPIKVSLVLGKWLHNVHHLVVQLHTVQVARGSNWILRRTSSALQTVTRCCGCCHCVFTRFLKLEEKPPDGYTWSRVRLTKKQTTSRPDLLPENLERHVRSSAPKRKTSGLSKNRSLATLEDCGICLIHPADAEFKETTRTI